MAVSMVLGMNSCYELQLSISHKMRLQYDSHGSSKIVGYSQLDSIIKGSCDKWMAWKVPFLAIVQSVQQSINQLVHVSNN